MTSNPPVAVVALFFLASMAAAQTFGVKKPSPRPEEYGNVVLNNFVESRDIAPVVFEHWQHRVRYTCRLCHVDLGFAMVAGQTGVREADNRFGLYCGACHDGGVAFGPLQQDGTEQTEVCVRCHSHGQEVERSVDFYGLVRGFPRARFGNRVDWLAAEERGLFELEDFLEGVSIRREPLQSPAVSEIDARAHGMPDILFSHEKHAVWNGCELCHPQIFGVKKGVTQYEMQDIFDGEYCGACHGKVAFTNLDCRLCHTEDVS